MRLLKTKSENIALTIITIHLILSPLWLLLLARLGGYIVNLCDFFFCNLIGKLTSFWQLQEFSLHNQTVDSSTTVTRRSSPSWNQRLVIFFLSLWHYGLYRQCTCVVKFTHSPITLANISSINLVSIFRCSSPPYNPVYVRRVTQF
jgi:hypothetical protein